MTDPRVEIFEKTVCYHGCFRLDRYYLRHWLFNGTWSGPLVREVFERGHAAAVWLMLNCEQLRRRWGATS